MMQFLVLVMVIFLSRCVGYTVCRE